VRRDIQSRRRHFFNKRVSLVNYVSPDTRPEEMLVDDSATPRCATLGDALTEMRCTATFFGMCSLSLVLHGTTRAPWHARQRRAMKVLAAHDGAFFEESYNLLNAWLAIMPGNGAYNLRRLALLETNLADLSFLFTRDTASSRTPPSAGRAAPLAFETPHGTFRSPSTCTWTWGTPWCWARPAAARASCSTSWSRTPSSTTRSPSSSTWGTATGSWRPARGATWNWVCGSEDVTINPFALAAHARAPALPARVRPRAARRRGRLPPERPGRPRDYEAVENLYVLDRAQRRLFTLANLLPRALAGRLQKWVEGGRYAACSTTWTTR
jgi:hypothetical protein